MVMSFLEYLAADLVDYVVVQTSALDTGPIRSALLYEGQWRPSGVANWMIRVDAENPSIRGQRHVHIAQTKHVSAKNMQASWNQDGTRHDRKSFNTNVGSQTGVQLLARKALGMADDAILESMPQTGVMLLESERHALNSLFPERTVFLRTI
jgi:hypothetical protein